MYRFLISCCLYMACSLFSLATQPEVVFKPFLKTQLWNAVSADDVSTYIRRGRVGMGITLGNTWAFSTCLEFDNTGKDQWAIPSGSLSDANVGLWDMYLSWKPLSDKNILVITSGYTLPQLSREVMTKPWFIPSLEKAKSSTFLRNFVTGKSNGISPMVNVGGVFGGDHHWYEYNASLIQAGKDVHNENSLAELLAGRFNLGLGKKMPYRYKKKSILSAEHNALVIGINGSYQGETQDFDANMSYGLDLIGNLKGLKASAEYSRMTRMIDDDVFKGNTGFVRISYNEEISNARRCEASLMFTFYDFDSNPFGLKSGTSSYFDVGFDFYASANVVKVSLHYTCSADESFYNINLSDHKPEALVLGLQFILI